MFQVCSPATTSPPRMWPEPVSPRHSQTLTLKTTAAITTADGDLRGNVIVRAGGSEYVFQRKSKRVGQGGDAGGDEQDHMPTRTCRKGGASGTRQAPKE